MTTRPLPSASPASTRDELAAQFQVSPSEIAAWQQALRRPRRRSPGRKTAVAALVALVAVSAFWSRPGVTAGCPDPSPPLPAGMTKFCPDTPAVAQDVNQNFAHLVEWLETCAGAVGGPGVAALPIPNKWIQTNNIQAKSVSGAHFANGAVASSNLQDGSLSSQKITDGSVTKSQLNTSAGTVPLYLSDPACSGGREQWISTSNTCAPTACSGSCPNPGTVPRFKCGGTFCDLTTCAPPPNTAGGPTCPMTQISGRLIK